VFELPQSEKVEVAVVEEPETAPEPTDKSEEPVEEVIEEQPEMEETAVPADEGTSPWVAIGGGVLAAGAGAWLAMSRRKKA
jgi:LPXTG-motif cell wall-anchored protein